MTEKAPNKKNNKSPKIIEPQVKEVSVDNKAKTFALVSFIVSFFSGVVGIIFGHLSLNRYNKQDNQEFRWAALVGLVLGYTRAAIYLFVLLIVIPVMALVVAWGGKDVTVQDSNVNGETISCEAYIADLEEVECVYMESGQWMVVTRNGTILIYSSSL